MLGAPDIVEQDLLRLANGIEDPRRLGAEGRERAGQPVGMEDLGQVDERVLHVVAGGSRAEAEDDEPVRVAAEGGVARLDRLGQLGVLERARRRSGQRCGGIGLHWARACWAARGDARRRARRVGQGVAARQRVPLSPARDPAAVRAGAFQGRLLGLEGPGIGLERGVDQRIELHRVDRHGARVLGVEGRSQAGERLQLSVDLAERRLEGRRVGRSAFHQLPEIGFLTALRTEPQGRALGLLAPHGLGAGRGPEIGRGLGAGATEGLAQLLHQAG
jgi:hypothetical protein